MTTYTLIHSPVGELLLTGDVTGDLSDDVTGGGAALSGLYPHQHVRRAGLDATLAADGSWVRDDDAFAAARAQLAEYFAGSRREFTLPLAAPGTAFQQAVWQELGRIGYGTTSDYGTIANRIGRPAAVRAVGAANGRNPISIIVPCHRVVGRDGSLTGYAGGLPLKQWLLRHEQRNAGLASSG